MPMGSWMRTVVAAAALGATAAGAQRMSGEIERLSGELNLSRSLVFQSPAMSRLALMVQRIGPRDVTVLLTGESGTGKERVAEALVRASPRASKAFVRFNCAALPQASLKERLDAYERGLIVAALDEAGGKPTHAARALGLNRGTLHSKLHKFGLASAEDAEDEPGADG